MAPDSVLQTEVFGPLSVLVEVADEAQMMALVSTLQGQLTATLHADADDRPRRRVCCRCSAIKPGGCCLTAIPPAWKCAMRWCTAAPGRPPPTRAAHR